MRDWADAILAFAPKPGEWLRAPTLEAVLTRDDGFALLQASPVQLAICRVLDGLQLGNLAEHPDVIEAMGGRHAVERYEAAPIKPIEFLLLAGIRSGKSLIVAACAVRAALTCDLSQIGPGEVPRVSILSLTVDTARATWSHVRGRMEASPALRALLAEEPTADRLVLKRPSDGRLVEIRVVAGSRAAGTLVARWSAGVIFDEAPRMVGSDDGVVNLDDARMAVAGRLLPGAQVLMVGSVWAPFGPTYELDQKHYGKPSAGVVVVNARGYQMNPSWWTPERCVQLKATNPDAYAVDVENQYVNTASGMMTLVQLETVRRSEPLSLPPSALNHYVAWMDPATRGNSWTLVVATRDGDRKDKDGNRVPFVRIAHAKQWTGSAAQPLSPRDTIREVKAELHPYRLSVVTTDQWAVDAIRDIAADAGLAVVESTWTGADKVAVYTALKVAVVDQTIELPPNNELVADLSRVKRRVTQQGISIELPLTADGRHCDYAPVVAGALDSAVKLPDVPAPVDGSPEWWAQHRAERIRALQRQMSQKRRTA